MTTTLFRNLRALIQLSSVLIILINIPLPFFLFINYKLANIEVDNLKMGFFSLTFSYKVIIIFNITLGMFASCGTNGKSKFYMRLYLLVNFLYMIVLITYILFIKNYYQEWLLEAFVNKSSTSVPQRVIMANLLNCPPSSNCEEPLKQLIESPKRIFLTVSLLSFVLHLISFVLIKIAVNIKIEKPPVKLPNFVTITKAGMDTQSLRTKRVMDVQNTSTLAQSVVV